MPVVTVPFLNVRIKFQLVNKQIVSHSLLKVSEQFTVKKVIYSYINV